MESAQRSPVSTWRNNNWRLKLEAKENSKGCLYAPIGIARFLASRLKENIKSIRPKVKIIEPAILIFVSILLKVTSKF
jgi:hypothetical protein